MECQEGQKRRRLLSGAVSRLTAQSMAEAEKRGDLAPDGLERPAVRARTTPQDVWYVRRERGHSRQLAAHNSTRKAASLINP